MDVLPDLLQDSIDDAPKSAGGIAGLLGFQNVLIGERAPLVWSNRAEGEERGKGRVSWEAEEI